MKKRKLFGWAFVATMMGVSFLACTNDAEEVLGQESEIRLTSEIMPLSRAIEQDLQATQIEIGQKVGVTITGAKDAHTNVAWVVGENGTLTNTGDPLYWTNDNVNIIAFHPFEKCYWNGTNQYVNIEVAIDQSDVKDYLNSDFLYVNQTSPRIEGPVELTFSHKLSKINITLTSTDITDLSNANIYICGTSADGKISAKEGIVEVSYNEVKDIKAASTDANATASAIIIPQTVTAGTAFIKIEHNNKSYYYTLSTDKTFISGNVYNYNLKLNEKDELKLVSSSINPWISSDTNNIDEDIDEDLGVEISVNAGSLSNLIGDNKNTITRLKLTGTLNESDLNFLNEMINYDYTFGYKGNLRELDLSETTIAGNKIELGGNILNSLVVPNDIETLYLKCDQLKSFNIPNSVKNITVSSQVLTSIDIPEGVENVDFSYSTALTTISIPEGVESVNLSYCTALISFEIPNGIELITYKENGGEELSGKKWIDLSYCYSLTSITLPNSITEIGEAAFNGCKKLASIDIPNNVTAIGATAFAGCTNLTSITIPSNVATIGTLAFSNCTSLNKIYCKIENPISIDSKVFENVPLSACTLYIPTGCKSAYEAADYWKNFGQIIEE